MSHPRRISRLIEASLLATALFVVAGCFAPAAAAAPPPNRLVEQVAGSQMFENGTGFTWGTSGNAFVIARTTDNGRSWTRLDLSSLSIGPGALAIARCAGPNTIFVHFADPTHGWLVWPTNEPELHIAGTADGGTSWREALTVPTDAVPEEELLPGPGRACLLAEMAEGMMHTTMVTVCTDDNGVTWTATTLPHGHGGKRWQEVDVPLPPGVASDDVGGTFPQAPSFSGPERLDGEMKVGLYMQNGMVSFIYRTTDGGMTWTGAKAQK